jgi:hypothetical protein
MTVGFTRISLEDYVELHLRANPGTKRADLIARLRHAMRAYRKGVRCQCGNPIWIIGSAEVGLACFTCITGEAEPDHDYELRVHGHNAAA